MPIKAKYGSLVGALAEIMPIAPIRLTGEHSFGEYNYYPFSISIQVFRRDLEEIARRLEVKVTIGEGPFETPRKIKLYDKHLEVEIWSY